MAGLLRRFGGLASRLSGTSGFSVAPSIASRPYTTVASNAVNVVAAGLPQEEAAAAPAKAKRVKKEKKPPSAYGRFFQDKYKETAAQHPDKKGMSAMASVMGELWSSLGESEKAKYQEAAAAGKAEWDAAHPKVKGAKKEKVKSDAPPRAPSAYNNFVKRRMGEAMKADGVDSAKQAMKVLGEEWQSLDAAAKEKYKS